MTDRTYRALLGGLLLIALSFDLNLLMYGLIVTLLIEGVTNWRIPLLVDRLRRVSPNTENQYTNWRTPQLINKLRRNQQNAATNTYASGRRSYRFAFEAERAWRLLVGSLLVLSFIFFYQVLWFIPWFMGFAIVGAGASGICPMEFSLKRLGFR
jgi:hypothetical protein